MKELQWVDVSFLRDPKNKDLWWCSVHASNGGDPVMVLGNKMPVPGLILDHPEDCPKPVVYQRLADALKAAGDVLEALVDADEARKRLAAARAALLACDE